MGKKMVWTALLILIPVLGAEAESEERSIQSFDKLRASGLLEVHLIEGSGRTATVSVEGTEMNEVVTEVEGKTLSVRMKKGILYDEREVKVRVDLSYDVLREILVTTGAALISDTTLRGDKITIEVNSGGKGDLKADVNTLDLKAVSGGVLTISGKTRFQDTTVNTGGKLNAFGLHCPNTYIRVNTGSVAEVTALNELEAQVGTGGTLHYRGNPAKTSIKKGLGATVKEAR